MRTILITRADPWLLQKIEAACRGGIDAIQIRDKESSAQDLLRLAVEARKITWAYNALLFINSRIDIALAAKADGVQLPENGLSPRLVKMHGLQAGVSVHSIEAARRAEKEGADFLLYSPVFASMGKGPPVGLGALKSLAAATALSVYALGGAVAEKIPSILEAGAYGAAAISAILDAPDVVIAAAEFKRPFTKETFQFKGILGIVSDLETAVYAIEFGVDAIQFRHKGVFTREAFELAQQIRLACRDIPFFINDRADVAKALDASGVHLGQTDLPIIDARRILGRNKIIGGTASNAEEALKLEKMGADYIGLGSIFPTRSKIKLTPPIGLEMVRKVKAQVRIPVIAIGGIDENNTASVFQAGADGIATISALPKILYARNLQSTDRSS